MLGSTPRSPQRAGHSDLRSTGGYFTDGINLYRFLGWVDGFPHQPLAAVEDCRSLDVLLVNGTFVARPGVRVVARHAA